LAKSKPPLRFSFLPYVLRDFCLLIFLSTFFTFFNRIQAQEPLNKPLTRERLAEAEAYFKSFDNDKAIAILEKILLELAQTDDLNTLLGLKVQLIHAEALEREEQDELAIQKLLHLVEVCKRENRQIILGDAHLSLARLHEKIGREETCLTHLRKVEYLIDQYELDSIYPRFAIRISSYHRIFGDRDSSIYYAKQVLNTAPKFRLSDEEATGHLLMGMLCSRTDLENAIIHFKKAGEIWLETKDYNGYCYIQANLSKLYFRNNQFNLALSYSDSALIAASKLIDKGHESLHSLYSGYKHRGDIYKALGEHDSAWIYLNKGYELELSEIEKFNKDKVIEIDAKYTDAKKAQRIEAQNQEIKYERDRRYLSMGLLLMFLVFFTILTYYYLRLRKANKKTKIQAQSISKKNEDLSILLEQQIMLRGELHHRVKNNLQIIISLIELQLEEVEDPSAKASLLGMTNRIYGMANIHDLLNQKEGIERINLLDYVNAICDSFNKIAGYKHKIELDIIKKEFNQDTLMPLGIIFHELITNSLKYAITVTKQLVIKIKVETSADGYAIEYRDNGPGFLNGKLEEREGGLGTYLLKSMIRQLNGFFQCRNEGGAVYYIFFKEKNTSK